MLCHREIKLVMTRLRGANVRGRLRCLEPGGAFTAMFSRSIADRLRHEWLPALKRWVGANDRRDTVIEAGDGTRLVSPGA